MASQTLTLRNDLAELPRLAEAIEAFCAPLRPGEDDLFSLQLALEEAVTNVIDHGFTDGQPHAFTVTFNALDEDRVSAMVADDAPAYDPLSRPAVDLSVPVEERPIGGLGVHLLKKLMDRVHYERRDGQNILTLERILRRTP